MTASAHGGARARVAGDAADGDPEEGPTGRRPAERAPADAGAAAARLFAGPGPLRALCRERDWASTPLGPVEHWPASLRTIAGMVLAAPAAMVVLWGPELIQLYNDGYRDVMGTKHPAGLGQPTRASWPEVWSFNAPLYEAVTRRGESFTFTDQPLVIDRAGGPEEAFFTLTYSPVPDDGGGVGGVLVTVSETTERVRARDARERERERLLAESEAARTRVTATLESIGDAFYAVGPDFRFTYVNRKAEALWGRSRDALLDRPLWTEFPQAVGSIPHREHLRVMRERRPAHFEARSAILDRWLDISIYPDETSGGLACYFRDISPRRQDEVERERLLREAQAARDAAERAAAAAEASEARYRTLFDSMDQGFCVVEVIFDGQDRPVDYRFLEANPAFEGQTGLVGAVGRTALQVVPDLEPHWFVMYGGVAATGEPVRFQNGSEPMGRWFDVNAFRIGQPELRRVALLFTDVTDAHRAAHERERLVAELSTERERLRSVILHTPAPLALLAGPEHRFEIVNAAYRRISGGGRDITGLTPAEAFPELEGQGIFELYDRVYETGEGWSGRETPVQYDRDGDGVGETWFDLRFEPLRDADGTVVAILNFAVDVTQQVRARQQMEALLAESERARAEAEAERRGAQRAARVTGMITTNLAEGLCMMDGEGRLTYMNPAAERMVGWTEDELRGEVLHDRVHYLRPDGRPYPIQECPLGRVLQAGGAVLGLADQWIRKDGSFVHVVTTCAPIVEEGRVVGAVLSLHDDTERRRTDAERERLLGEAERARAEAEEANRAKSQFLAVMSHELRTPLNAIGGYAELLEMGIRGPVTPAQREDLARIQTSQRHLLGLINEVLNYARIETGTVHYELDDVPVGEVVSAAESLVAPQALGKGLTLFVEECPPGLTVRADGEKVRQIVVNLLSNAVKFTDSGGRVDVTCGAEGADVAVRVRDTGIGIPADKLQAVFDPFVQVRADLTRTAEGTGLGLAISRDLARGMGGDLRVESTPDLGSTFILTLPAE